MKAHPAAEIIPPPTEAEFAALYEDIRAHGQLQPIVLFDGMILDGRQRWRICELLGRHCKMVRWERRGLSAEQYVLSMNIRRRQLSESQLGLVGARLANMGRSNGAAQRAASGETAVSIADAAVAVGVSPATIKRARLVLVHGTPADVAAIEKRAVNVTAAGRKIRQEEQMTDAATAPEPTARKAGHPKGIVKAPEGAVLGELTRATMQRQAEEQLSDAAAADIAGIPRHAYSRMRDVVLVAAHTGLSKADSRAGIEALAYLNETRDVTGAYERVSAIADRLWGEPLARQGGIPRERIQEIRTAHFDRAVGTLLQVCGSAADIEVPYLSPKKLRDIDRQLGDAIAAIRNLRLKILNANKEQQ